MASGFNIETSETLSTGDPVASVIRTFGVLLFLAPAIIALAQESWTTEAGSLAPIVILLGAWTIFNTLRAGRAKEAYDPGSLLLWGVLIVPVILIYAFAQAIEMTALMALAAWTGTTLTIYGWFGGQAIRRCAVPLMFTALCVPLPYALSVQLNAELRTWTSEHAVNLADKIGLDAALGQGEVIIGPYVLAVENACAGTSTTLSLVAIGVLYAYWIRKAGMATVIGLIILAIPIALAANVIRVVGLLALVSIFGDTILDTVLHPLSGVLSFVVAAMLLGGSAALISRAFKPSNPLRAAS